MVGDTLQHLTKGYYTATEHRVIRPQEDRVSFPFLFRGRPEAVLNTLSAKPYPGQAEPLRFPGGEGTQRESKLAELECTQIKMLPGLAAARGIFKGWRINKKMATMTKEEKAALRAQLMKEEAGSDSD